MGQVQGILSGKRFQPICARVRQRSSSAPHTEPTDPTRLSEAIVAQFLASCSPTLSSLRVNGSSFRPGRKRYAMCRPPRTRGSHRQSLAAGARAQTKIGASRLSPCSRSGKPAPLRSDPVLHDWPDHNRHLPSPPVPVGEKLSITGILSTRFAGNAWRFAWSVWEGFDLDRGCFLLSSTPVLLTAPASLTLCSSSVRVQAPFPDLLSPLIPCDFPAQWPVARMQPRRPCGVSVADYSQPEAYR